MKFLSLKSYFEKDKKNSHKNTTETICKEHLDLYEDEDFLEVLAMNSAEVRAEISSSQESPDEIVALIRGRLDKKIIPLKNNKEVIEPINIMTFLSNLVDKKIIMDAFNNPPKKKAFTGLFIPLSSVLMVSIIAVFVAPPIVGNPPPSTLKEENIALIQKNQQLKREMTKLIEQQKLELAADDTVRLHVVEYDANNTSPIELSHFREDSSLTLSILKNSLTDDYLVTTNFDIPPVANRSKRDDNISPQPDIVASPFSAPDLSLNLTKGDNLYLLLKKHDLLVKNWDTLNGLSSLQEGSKLIIKADNNYVKKVTYIKKDGSSTAYEIEDDRINTYTSTLYYPEDLVITGNIVTSLSASLKNNKQLRSNISIAHIITQKVEQYLKTEPSVDFRKMRPDAPYKIEVTVRKSWSDNKIIHVDKVKVDLIDNYIIASNTST